MFGHRKSQSYMRVETVADEQSSESSSQRTKCAFDGLDEENYVKSKNTGFTLIELLVVVAILASLTAVILPNFNSLETKTNHVLGALSDMDIGRLIVTNNAAGTDTPTALPGDCYNVLTTKIDAKGGAANFKGVFGTDGDLKGDMANAMFK
jgi:prepilin-type N-terminal cleavage/methylation domain-containing protein